MKTVISTDDMISHTENPKESDKLEACQFAGYMINI